jgi:hypothetical protein
MKIHIAHDLLGNYDLSFKKLYAILLFEKKIAHAVYNYLTISTAAV